MATDISTSSTPSLTPPLTEEELLNWLRLLRSRRVGVTTFFRLLAEHGTADAALSALPGVARDAGVTNYAACPMADAEAEYRAGQQAGAQLVPYGAAQYPVALSQIPDPPPLLWMVGDLGLLKRPLVAMVGARNASSLGLRMAGRLARELAESGHVLVSGMARGIDAAVHEASLRTGTVAVQAGGVDVIYPVENAVLGQEIAEQGLRLSEQPMHLTPQARHFPRRNRIISGLAQALVVVEAAAKSGSLITARTALDQGRDVMAVPGHPFDARASGCNMLIRDGATLVRGADDVIEALQSPQDVLPRPVPETDVPKPPAEQRTLADTVALHDEILARLGPAPVAEDQLIRDLKRKPADITSELVVLELDGRIERQAGGLLSRRA